jgi:hypothetical protein
MVGVPPTLGSLGYFLPSALAGPLCPEHDPADRIWLRARSAEAFVSTANKEYGQHLTFTPLEAAFGRQS